MVNRAAFSMIELIFAIVVIAITVLSLPMMTDVTSSSSADTMKAEEAIFEAYVKALEVTDGAFLTSGYSDTNSSLVTASAQTQGLKYNLQADVNVTQGGGFGGLDAGDNNISFVSITVKDGADTVAKIYTYDFNVQR